METMFRMKEIHGEFFRFLVAGTINTVSSYLLYLVMLVFFSYLLAYSLSYCISIVLSYFLNARFVFRQRAHLSTFLIFPAVYAIQYCLGALMLWLLVDHAGVSPQLAMAGVIAATVPVTFLTSRFVLRKR